MDPLRKQLAALLTYSTQKGIKKLDPHSSCFRVLEGIDNIHTIIEEDICKICEVVTMDEVMRILSLSAKIKISPREKRRAIKEKLKLVAEGVVEKAEDNGGKLRIPAPCRYLLINL